MPNIFCDFDSLCNIELLCGKMGCKASKSGATTWEIDELKSVAAADSLFLIGLITVWYVINGVVAKIFEGC